jgi:hypothetical protein
MLLSDAQREMLCQMTNSAYLEIRQLAEAGRFEQGFELAAAFHHLLDDMWSDEFNLPEFRDRFRAEYQSKHSDPTTKDYVAWLDLIIAMGNGNNPKSDSPPKTPRAPQ